MKILSGWIAITILILLTLGNANAREDTEDFVSHYRDVNYTGHPAYHSSTSMSNLPSFINSEVTSIVIRHNKCAAFFSSSAYGGHSLIIFGGRPDTAAHRGEIPNISIYKRLIGTGDWNDEISSFRIYDHRPDGGCHTDMDKIDKFY